MQGTGVVQPSEERPSASTTHAPQQPARPTRQGRGASSNPRSGQFESLNDAADEKNQNTSINEPGEGRKAGKFGTDMIPKRVSSQSAESRALQNKNNVHALYN
mmetsp:Transcript_34663/g.53066  ORF Transcript_34663/g.53066 Transcript_34663/m.53066 type:complete len:103 (+) Transcript_34663:1711-2019(+)